MILPPLLFPAKTPKPPRISKFELGSLAIPFRSRLCGSGLGFGRGVGSLFRFGDQLAFAALGATQIGNLCAELVALRAAVSVAIGGGVLSEPHPAISTFVKRTCKSRLVEVFPAFLALVSCFRLGFFGDVGFCLGWGAGGLFRLERCGLDTSLIYPPPSVTVDLGIPGVIDPSGWTVKRSARNIPTE